MPCSPRSPPKVYSRGALPLATVNVVEFCTCFDPSWYVCLGGQGQFNLTHIDFARLGTWETISGQTLKV
jgi:hypothetical protein